MFVTLWYLSTIFFNPASQFGHPLNLNRAHWLSILNRNYELENFDYQFESILFVILNMEKTRAKEGLPSGLLTKIGKTFREALISTKPIKSIVNISANFTTHPQF